MITSLKNASTTPGVGPKARRLSELMNAGFDVPRGFVVTAGAELDAQAIEEVTQEISAKAYAVRSSFAHEDSEHHSFAGIFESVVDVKVGELVEAIEHVRGSANAPRAVQYGEVANVPVSSAGMAVIVQEMVDADHYGVCFTKDPAFSDDMLMTLGSTPEGVTSGESGEAVTLPREGHVSDAMHKTIRDTVLAIEDLFGTPQDIEFAVRETEEGFSMMILQTRPIMP